MMKLKKHSFVILFAVITAVFSFVSINTFAEEITEPVFQARCVDVLDGDSLLAATRDKKFEIRLHGVDAPEFKQQFGEEAKQFTQKKALDKILKITIMDTDKYGRIVGKVSINSRSLNYSLVKNGFAWHYKKYSANNRLASAQKEAQRKNLGLWSLDDPVAPWDYRSKDSDQEPSMEPSTEPLVIPQEKDSSYHGNPKSLIYHASNCKYYNCGNCTKSFDTCAEAEQNGYAACRICSPVCGYNKDDLYIKDYKKDKNLAPFHGNSNSKVFHKKSCRYYNCGNCTVSFRTKKEALKKGFEPCGICIE